MVISRRLFAVLGTIFVGLAAPGSHALAQDADHLAGTWVLSVPESNFGSVRAPESAVLEVRRASSTLEMTSTQEFADAEGPQSLEIEVATDGSVQAIETPRGTTLVSATWDGDVMVVWRHAQANVGEIEITDRYDLDDSGKRLEVAQSIEIPGRSDVFRATLVYERADD